MARLPAGVEDFFGPLPAIYHSLTNALNYGRGCRGLLSAFYLPSTKFIHMKYMQLFS